MIQPAAVLASAAAFFLTLILVLQFDYPNLERVGLFDIHPVGVAMFFCAVLAATFAALQPSRAFRLAVLSSSFFWGFFGVVFACYLANGDWEWAPLRDGLLSLISAVIAAIVSGILVQRRQARTKMSVVTN